MKKRICLFFKIAAIAVFLFSVNIFLTTCDLLTAVVNEPDVSFNSVDLESININGARLLCNTTVTNPNSFNIPSFPETNWKLYMDGKFLLASTVNEDQGIPAKGSVNVNFPVYVEFLNLFKTIVSLKENSSAKYKLELEVIVPIDILGKTKILNTEHEGEIPLLQLPRLNPPSIKFGTVSLSGMDILISFDFENPNDFDLPSPKIDFDYQVNGSSIIGGGSKMPGKPLAKSTTTTIEQPLDISFANISLAAATAITTGHADNAFSYSCDFGLEALGGNILNTVLPVKIPVK
jgi:LEA14-like dessication related protein